MSKGIRYLIFLVIILTFATNAACFEIEVPNGNEIATQQVDRLQKIKEKGVLTVASPNDVPYSYLDPKTGVFSGLDADIIREVAKRLGVGKVVVRYSSFSNLLEEVVNNPGVDMIGQGIFATDERKELVNFTAPIYTNKDEILIKKGSIISSKEDLKNSTIGVVGGKVYTSLAENWKSQGVVKDYIIFFDTKSLLTALENGTVDAILTESMFAENSILMQPKSSLKLLSPTQYKPEINFSVGYPLKKEDTTLLNAINEKLQEMKNDGTIYEILARYGLTKYYIS